MQEFRFARVFAEGCILQRDVPFTVWGSGAAGEVVVELCGEHGCRSVCRADGDGSFFAEFPAVKGGKSFYSLRASCAAGEVVVEKVRFGDVYLLLGQSNMSYPLSAVEGRTRWAKKAARADVSFLSLAEPPLPDVSQVFRPVDPLSDLARDYEYVGKDAEKISAASAIGVMTAVLLSESAGVPVGMVDTSMGGLSVEAYLPRECAEGDAEVLAFLKRADRYVDRESYNKCGGRNFTQLAGVYNEKIAPLSRLRFRAMAWYLGESSAFDLESALFFERELRMIVHAYRRMFGEIPFAAVQIAPEYYPYGDRFGYLYVNESLDRLAREEKDVFVIPTYTAEPRWLVCDGDLYYHPIHPVNKEPIAAALARVLFENAVCGRRYAFPRIESAEADGEGGFVCRLADAGAGLDGREPYGFCLCGEDGKYYPARAQVLAADCIRLTSPCVARPQGMTYAFAQYQEDCDAALCTGEPLLPYRTCRESVHDGYFQLPHFMRLGKKYVYENCFGYSVGTCRKVARWEKGCIYGNNCRISALDAEGDGMLQIGALPRNEGFYFFGASPRVCLSGHRSGLADYPFLHLELGASVEGVSFFGVAVRLSSGEVFRFAPLRRGEPVDEVPLSVGNFSAFCVGLERAYRGDSAFVPLSQEEQKNIVEAEFLFRCRTECNVFLRRLGYVSAAESFDYFETEKKETRADMQLPVSR